MAEWMSVYLFISLRFLMAEWMSVYPFISLILLLQVYNVLVCLSVLDLMYFFLLLDVLKGILA